ncbi:protein SHORT HYPOCOTYL IN WHITE LIGHT 1-like [Phoenix dactylifera]|uniref:Protein SHORT HYPOCOTYL IN WHITE LIGHT 1-like n=1 Tax=Phoenix dactylifera TaxID=42345 RepID=A0A8B7BUM4_PHODC|nr:protein SHORT HYPOCOTYL IN WHITE LIGHT 1-like [Phoenix dactylifera]
MKRASHQASLCFDMAYSTSVSFSLPRLRSSHPSKSQGLLPSLPLFAAPSRLRSPLRASRKLSSYPQEAVVVLPDARAWVGDLGGYDVDDDDGDEDDDDGDDRSLDLLARFLDNVFRKISRRARKAVLSVLPPSVPTKLVGFSVNGVLILAFLWILKALLEVICTLGSIVFVSILFVRGVWSGVSYIRENQYSFMNRIDNDDSRWSGAQAAT